MYKQVYDSVDIVYRSIYLDLEENIAFWTYRWKPTHVPPIQHGNQGGIAYPSLARHVEITVSQCNCLHFILVRWNLLRAWMQVDFLEQKNSSSSGHGEGSPSTGSCWTGGWDASSIAASRCPPRNPVTGYKS
jgi:hypothetical protein